MRQGVPRPKCIRPVFRLTVVCSIEPMGVWSTHMHYELAHAHRCGVGRGSRGFKHAHIYVNIPWVILEASLGRYHPCVSGIGNWLLYVVQNKLMYVKHFSIN